MTPLDISNYCIEQLKQAGAHKSQCGITFSEKKELWFPEYDEQTICILRADLKITDC